MNENEIKNDAIQLSDETLEDVSGGNFIPTDEEALKIIIMQYFMQGLDSDTALKEIIKRKKPQSDADLEMLMELIKNQYNNQ